MTTTDTLARLSEAHEAEPAFQIGARLQTLHGTLSDLRDLQRQYPDLMRLDVGDLLTAHDALTVICNELMQKEAAQ